MFVVKKYGYNHHFNYICSVLNNPQTLTNERNTTF